jgi:hypothetical protein
VGYHIHFALRAGTLKAVIFGKVSDAYARYIARDIAEEAKRQAVKRVLIDVRWLRDRLGSLGTLSRLPAGDAMPRRIALVDDEEFDRYYAMPELLARRAGAKMRRFPDAAAAMQWLSEPADQLS